ncbi:MAG: sigma-70 family RNA polymerase sigma factor [Bifidobacteriaceae bacterium]|nr:sigma-70 family RNA polymerase sigma factor [Bifidobacteriaceae bacterium]
MLPDDRLATSMASPSPASPPNDGPASLDPSPVSAPALTAPRAQPDAPGARAKALAGTESAVQRYGDMVFGVAVTHTNCQGDAEDVFQDVFLTYHRRQPRCHSEEHRKAWILRTTLNIAQRTAMSSWRTRVVPLTVDDPPAPSATSFTFATDRQNAVFGALGRLPESIRTVLYLFYFEDLPVAQIADLLDLSPAAIKMRLSRGRSQMRDQLREEIFDD